MLYFPGFIEFPIVYTDNFLSRHASNHQTRKKTRSLRPVGLNTIYRSDLLQVGTVGQLPKSGGYSYVVTAVDVFSEYMFAQPITSPSVEV